MIPEIIANDFLSSWSDVLAMSLSDDEEDLMDHLDVFFQSWRMHNRHWSNRDQKTVWFSTSWRINSCSSFVSFVSRCRHRISRTWTDADIQFLFSSEKTTTSIDTVIQTRMKSSERKWYVLQWSTSVVISFLALVFLHLDSWRSKFVGNLKEIPDNTVESSWRPYSSLMNSSPVYRHQCNLNGFQNRFRRRMIHPSQW